MNIALSHDIDEVLGTHRGGAMPWALLVVRSVASLAANVAVAGSAVNGAGIAVWPSSAPIAAYELERVRYAAAPPVALRCGSHLSVRRLSPT